MTLTSAEGTDLNPEKVLTAHLHADAADPEALDMLIPARATRCCSGLSGGWMDGWAGVYANAAPDVGVLNLAGDPGREAFKGSVQQMFPASRGCSYRPRGLIKTSTGNATEIKPYPTPMLYVLAPNLPTYCVLYLVLRCVASYPSCHCGTRGMG